MLSSKKTYKMLDFVGFNTLVNWSVQYFRDSAIKFNRKYSLMRIGDFLTRNKTGIEIQDNETYKRATIRVRNGGIYLRDIQDGRYIGTKKQFLIKAGQFLLSKIDARNGAFGVVPEELDGGIITGNFWTFDVDYAIINPHYLTLLTTTKQFIDFCEQASNGTTNRHYLQEPLFLNIKVTVPSLEEQRELVNAFNEKVDEVRRLGSKINKIYKDIDDYLIMSLGIAPQYNPKEKNMKFKYLKFIKFSDISEWGVDIIQQKQKREKFKYPVIKVKNLCQLGSGGTPSRSFLQYYKGNIPWVKTGEVVNEEIFETEEHITEDAIANSSVKLYPKGSLIIAMYGQGETRGRTAKLGIDATTNQACAVLYNIDHSIINTDYLWYYLQGRYHDLRSMASGNNQPNLNADKISNFEVVVPPIDIQSEIVDYIKKQKVLLKRYQQDVLTLRKKAIKEFENKIFE